MSGKILQCIELINVHFGFVLLRYVMCFGFVLLMKGVEVDCFNLHMTIQIGVHNVNKLTHFAQIGRNWL